MKNLLKIALRQNAIFIPKNAVKVDPFKLSETTAVLVANLSKLGFDVTEPLLHGLNCTTPVFKLSVLDTFRAVMGVQKNWTPLVKGWDTPTGESVTDHIITFFVNAFNGRGAKLACGHTIPANTFPLERYNGCPFCGTPFEFGKIENYGQGSKNKILNLWTEDEMSAFFKDLLESKTALDATQMESLKALLLEMPLPKAEIGVKETRMAVIDALVSQNQAEKAQEFFETPTDVLRYLWFKHTGFFQIIEPKTIVKRHAQNNRHLATQLDGSDKATVQKRAELKLKYDRKMGLIAANWLNNLTIEPEKMGEMIHPKRAMWVRFVRALRLAEFSKRAGFEPLAALLDVFYNKKYPIWQGRVEYFRLRSDAENTFALLKQRPGLFARSLFANMLWFGKDETIAAFSQVLDKVPARLVFTLNMYAENYFNPTQQRTVKPLGGVSKTVAANPLLSLYDAEQLESMKKAVEDLCYLVLIERFSKIENANKTMFIDPTLFKMPLAIGDRSDTVQDMPVALMGTRFPIEGDTVRLFMQWGGGLPAQHLDMDLSCHVAFEKMSKICSYSQLATTGCKHSGDIQSIPAKVGTAEYIDINIADLRKAKAKYVTFTCNAYSNGSISPNLVIGWMNSKFPMRISQTSGVAYDPSCVQHQVRVTQNVAKGLVFGVLDVENAEIVWLEMPFQGQVIQQLDSKNVTALLAKLNAKMSIGNFLKIKAEAQSLSLIETADADEIYTRDWAMNAAGVTKMFVD